MKKRVVLSLLVFSLIILYFSAFVYADTHLYKQNIEKYKPLIFVTSREYKFLLDPLPFLNDMNKGYLKLWNIAKEVAKEMGFIVKENEAPFNVSLSSKIYMDTKDAILRKGGYVLRKQIKYKKGKPTISYKFTGKFISPNLYKVIGINFPLPKDIKSSRKIEENISFDKNGHLRSYFENAIKVKTKKDLCGDIFKDWKKLFEGLGGICIPNDTKLIPRIAYSYVVEPGKIIFSNELSGKVEIELWTHKLGGAPFTGEFSFTVKTKGKYYKIGEALKKSEEFYKAFAIKASDFAPKDAFKWNGSKVRILFNMPVEK